MKELPSHLREKILGRTRAIPAPTRRDWQMQSALAMLLAFALSVGIFLAVGGIRPGARPGTYVAGVSIAWAAVSSFAAYFSMQRGRSSVGRPGAALVTAFAASPVALAAVVVIGRLVWPESRFADEDRNDLRCAFWTAVFGAGPLLAFLWSRRHVIFSRPYWVSAAVGAATFGFGSFLITLRCTCASPTHMLLGHVLPVALLGALSGLVGLRVLGRPVLEAPPATPEK